ncbi:OmpH family outer membrane protein [Gemmata sp. JC717]|uniref:OmpH family outer membrane protein n=1 Tax=Gemmata algarum TaxID=2975278 RepID=A0ABU5F7F3_9BACT|nr:OmpH family outer membrane protein [Gemmata algarum]MDY3554312.1 OmpH family outer membrane protein [Gemmata algarum]MDY3562707.1 OmpH family outer membrane protein [Gemmata algarum]
MKRTWMLLSGLLGVVGTVGLARAQAPAPGAAAPPAGAPAGAPATRPTVAVFNMAGVMRDFGQAKYQVHLLNTRKNEMSKQLLGWRGEYIQIQQDLQKNPNPPDKEQKVQRMLALSRAIEDEDRKINKQLNDDASAIISDLYDKIKMVVDKTAEMNGYHIVFAYPDAVTAEELKSPYIKELKLKPPAAQPFYVAGHADITGIVVKTLNTWYQPKDAQGNVIDVSKLDIPAPAPGSNGLPGSAPAAGAPKP